MSPFRAALALIAAGIAILPLYSEDLLKTDILGVFAHPDDETGAAGTLAAYALGHDAVIANVYCTRGEGGGNMVGTQSGPALGILREIELRQCLATLGIRRCFFLDQTDFAYTESLAITLEKWGHEETLRRLVRHVRTLRPEIILTMNPAPNPGQHGNHQAAGVLAIEAFDAAADPARFPEQLRDEGLTVWQVRKLYYGGPAGTGATIDLTVPLKDGRTAADVAGDALAFHRSQGFGGFANSPWLRRPQNWTLVKSVVPFATDETDLRRGLPVAGETPPRVASPPPPTTGTDAELRFVSRPAVDWFQRWTREQKIDAIAARFVPDLPVVAGEPNSLPFALPDSLPNSPGDKMTVSVPDGWRAEIPAQAAVGAPSARTVRHVTVVPPQDATSDVEIVAIATVGNREIRGTARLHPVPHMTIPRLTTAPPLSDADAAAEWSRLPAHAIQPSQTWQGTVTNAADCSATFRAAHDGSRLYLEIRVRDDHVVSNIAPNDIKGHWRSDSVELCLDPNVGAEHTLSCYKLGIFPFDATGRVRAARDADARPGLVEETSPGTRLVSWKTSDGYAIRASIPLDEVGSNLSAGGRRLGFNILIYDGDKTDAAPGENINRSRLAWAPRSGVQGRPEDWGRADLE